jgi:hypothetical protein
LYKKKAFALFVNKTHYNLGRAYQYTFKFAEALKSFKKAESLYPQEKDYTKAIDDCKKMEAEFKKLQTQQKD